MSAGWPHEWLRDCNPIVNFIPVQCFRVESRIGAGTEYDPVRIVRTWFTANGDLIAHHDDHLASRADTPEDISNSRRER